MPSARTRPGKQGELVFAVTIDTGSSRTFTGHRFKWSPHTRPLAENNILQATRPGPGLGITLDPDTIEFWVENG
jgi:hypothetical protein